MKLLKKLLVIFIFLLILIPLISAENDDECGWNNLGSCLAQKFFGFVAKILSAPIKPLLRWTYDLMTKPVNISMFSSVWSIIIYILSMFYGLLLLYSGFKFIISGQSAEKREQAKSFLTNVIIMIVLVQASYFIYSLIISLGSSLTTVIFNMIPQNFFLISIDTIEDVGLQLLLLIPYALSIITVLILLTLRYICVAVGVVFFALGIFCYFIGPLNQYGRLIINGLMVLIFLPFSYSIVFLASSKLLGVGTFSDIKILVMMGAFAMVICATLTMLLFVVMKAATKVAGPVSKVVSLVKGG